MRTMNRASWRSLTPSPGPLPTWVSWTFLFSMVGLAGLFLLISHGAGAFYVFGLMGLAASVAGFYGLYRNAPGASVVWRLLAIAPPVALAGTVVGTYLPHTETGIFLFLSDLMTIPAYICYVLAFGLLLHYRRGANADTIMDGFLVGISVLLGMTLFTLTPEHLTSGSQVVALILVGTYPALSAVAAFSMLLLSYKMAHLTAFKMMAALSMISLVAEVFYVLDHAGTLPVPAWLVSSMYALFYVMAGMVALHPSVRPFTNVADATIETRRYGRFVGVSVALALPVLVVLFVPMSDPVVRFILVAGMAVLGTLVFFRVTRAVRDHARVEAELQHQATHDVLTGLPNRTLLDQLVSDAILRARVTRNGVAVLFLDLDRFKSINDNWGHAVGDKLLTEVSRRVTGALRPGEVMARVSGDEFVVVLTDVNSAQEALGTGHRLLASFAAPFLLKGTAGIEVAPSVGVAFTNPSHHVATSESLIREADMAMYRSKGDPRHAVTLFDESMRSEVSERVALETDLRGALAEGQVHVHYQPIVDMEDGLLTGFEALMRWEHPTLGSVPPMVFIPVAEETLQIVELGRWVIRESVAQLAQWQQMQGPDEELLTVSVNLSPRQLHDPELVKAVRDALDQNGVPAETLWLEITESAMFEDDKNGISILDDLKSLGISLSADDFGTGYSSLSYLQKFPVDQLKIDRSFVSSLGKQEDAEAIVASITSLAAALDLSLVAEGVETPEQRAHLTALGCRRAQGFLFSPPLPADEATNAVTLGRPLVALRSA